MKNKEDIIYDIRVFKVKTKGNLFAFCDDADIIIEDRKVRKIENGKIVSLLPFNVDEKVIIQIDVLKKDHHNICRLQKTRKYKAKIKTLSDSETDEENNLIYTYMNF